MRTGNDFFWLLYFIHLHPRDKITPSVTVQSYLVCVCTTSTIIPYQYIYLVVVVVVAAVADAVITNTRNSSTRFLVFAIAVTRPSVVVPSSPSFVVVVVVFAVVVHGNVVQVLMYLKFDVKNQVIRRSYSCLKRYNCPPFVPYSCLDLWWMMYQQGYLVVSIGLGVGG